MRAMPLRMAAGLLAVGLLSGQAAQAENQMGYRLLDSQQAAQMPRGGGTLGLDVGRGQIINDNGLRFELLLVQNVRRDSPAGRVGLNVGDQLIAVDGFVFPSIATFASYVGSLPPGRTIGVDYLPRGGGPEKAQRIGVTLGGPASGRPARPEPPVAQESQGLSTGQKIAIGAGAVALFGCYKLGCFNRHAQPQH
jgi:S1-C subfamily serine protease